MKSGARSQSITTSRESFKAEKAWLDYMALLRRIKERHDSCGASSAGEARTAEPADTFYGLSIVEMLEAKEIDAAAKDLLHYGRCFMKDGKRVPLESIEAKECPKKETQN